MILNEDTRIAKALRIVGLVLGGLALAVTMAFLFGYFVMHLWNWLMPTLFGLPHITYWMAFGIIILARLIFGGFGHPHDKKERCRDDKFKRWVKHGKSKHSHKEKWDKFRHYHDFWEAEGKKAFEEYLEKKKEVPGDSGLETTT